MCTMHSYRVQLLPHRTILQHPNLCRDPRGSWRGPWSIAGRWVWHWKDRIDRRFIGRFSC
jgi:hypothetical protein